jgi:UDP-N-acetylglucosamine diphosphorylase / glucose-1-phosphate thymidylyltransferase / UDP-N-acetylgalactosamine diphosphorylase / glucosamine-1-phosphate N-acetyltransferase / galactosamine-1-phosphate N-acetyltransferase
MINVIIPMAGLGSRFSNHGYKIAKPFIPVLGKPMIQNVVENLNLDANYYLILRKEHYELHQDIIKEIQANNSKINFIIISKVTEGPLSTCLFAHKYINNDHPLLIANSDQIIDISFDHFVFDAMQKEVDGSILTFFDKNPKWSYVELDDQKLVIRAVEKQVISNYATAGVYFFKKGKQFLDASIDLIINNDRVNNEFYVCPVYNYMIKNRLKIGIYNINQSKMHGIGTPEDLNDYLDFRSKNGKV